MAKIAEGVAAPDFTMESAGGPITCCNCAAAPCVGSRPAASTAS